jgi:hypothetical protein
MRHVRLPLSSAWTPLFRFGFPLLANAAAVVLLVRWMLDSQSTPLASVMLALLTASLLTWYCAGLTAVHQEGDSLVISARQGDVRVPASHIDHVTQFWWARPGVVTVHFREPTPIGRTVSFVPEASVLSFIGLGWLDDQVVMHLRQLAKRARARAAEA